MRRQLVRLSGRYVFALALLALAACTSLLGIEEIDYFEPEDASSGRGGRGDGATPPSPDEDAGEEIGPDGAVVPAPPGSTCRPTGGPCSTNFVCCDAGKCAENNTCQSTCRNVDAGCDNVNRNQCCIGFVCRSTAGGPRCVSP